MNTTELLSYPCLDIVLKQRLICVAVIDKPESAVPLAEALLAGGMNVIEVTFRTSGAAEAIRRIREARPDACVGAGTVLTPHQAAEAAEAGAQFLVAPGFDEAVLKAARQRQLPYIPGVVTPTEVMRALEWKCPLLKFFPAEVSGGVAMLKTLAGPFSHTGVKFVPTGGVTSANLTAYLALPQVAAIGGSWMAEREMVARGDWGKITALAGEAIKVAGTGGVKNSE